MTVMLQAEPEPLEIDISKTAVIMIDMQNAFVSRGGMCELWGAEIYGAQRAIGPIKTVTTAARAKGCKVIYIVHTYAPDLCDSGGAGSPNWYKERSLRDYHEHPEWRDKLIIQGTWGAQVVDALKPEAGDVLIEKPKYSAFYGTKLDTILKTCGIRYLLFTGVTTNICVETSIRDAYNLEYFSVLVSDGTASIPPDLRETTIHNVQRCFGWVTTAENVVKALG